MSYNVFKYFDSFKVREILVVFIEVFLYVKYCVMY